MFYIHKLRNVEWQDDNYEFERMCMGADMAYFKVFPHGVN
jgi:hypothetical protein